MAGTSAIEPTVTRAPHAENRVIWMYWNKGYDAAPALVRICIDSWIAKNPTWPVIVLDDAAVPNYVDIPDLIDGRRRDITIQKVAVLLRTTLLARYGGVWADATVYCSKPLDSWLPAHTDAGFFAFKNPGPDRMLSNWFMFGQPGNLITENYQAALIALFRDNRFTFQHKRAAQVAITRLAKLLSRDTRTTRYWFSWPVRRLLRAYPYFITHYAFAKMIEDDAACRVEWQAIEPVPAAPFMRIQDLQWQADGLRQAKTLIDSADLPMHKLDWRVDSTNEFWSAVLAHLQAV
jgi:hypothetical protein